MQQVTITIPETTQISYPIYIGKNLLEKISVIYPTENYSKIIILTDKNIAPHFLDKTLQSLPKETISLNLDPGEKEKNIESLQKIWKHLLNSRADRKSLLINLGGGVIGDIGGFAASTYMRGIDFINIPTTILAQVDESVGGKTGFDFADIKNLIGTFDQPKAVLIDVETLKTLPEREFLSGFAEIIKHGIITDKKYFDKVTSKKPIEFNEDDLIDIIKESCEIKAAVIENDEKENGLRKKVNFGHTIGHAIEAVSLETDNPLLHGEAVSIGMVVESKMSFNQGLLSKKEMEQIKKSLTSANLPVEVQDFDVDQMIKKMKLDKKNKNGKINFTLLKKIGEAVIDQIISEEIIKKTLNEL
jgi:3-dehydroquinate synthase